jgi:gas vesicle protein
VYNACTRRTFEEVDEMRKTLSLLIGLLAGAAVGAAAAILLAPYSGAELKQRMRTRVQDLVEEGKRAAAARRVELEAQLEAFKRGTPVTIETTSETPQA